MKQLLTPGKLRNRQSIKVGIVSMLLFYVLFMTNSLVFARQYKNDYPGRLITRGEAVHQIMEAFDLSRTKRSFLQGCKQRPDECFFVFAAMSDYDDISFSPLQLYPDVYEKYRYYKAINTASMLGLIHGYLNEKKTPFKPEIVITRIQALKIVLGAANLVHWKDRFELTEEESGQRSVYVDDSLTNADNWWYHRYLVFSYDNNITSDNEFFRPDDTMTIAELNEMIENALALSNSLKNYDTKTLSRGDQAK